MGGHYRLGPAALRLGLSALAQQDAVELARAEMARLSELTGDTVFLSVWGHAGATVISRFDGTNVAPLAVRVGAVMPLATSATGRMFLAWLPEQHTKPILKRERPVRAATAKLPTVLAQVRRDGFAVTPGAVAAGMIAIAAPVFDYSRRLQCVLTLTEHASNLDDAARGALARALRQGADSGIAQRRIQGENRQLIAITGADIRLMPRRASISWRRRRASASAASGAVSRADAA